MYILPVVGGVCVGLCDLFAEGRGGPGERGDAPGSEGGRRPRAVSDSGEETVGAEVSDHM